MEHVFTKTTAIEIGLTSLMFYFFPKTSLVLFSVPLLYKIYSDSQLKQSELPAGSGKMNATIYTYGKEFRLVQMDIPKFGANDVLVKVHGASINPVDYKVRTPNLPYLRWFLAHTVGRDFAGVVMDVGSNVKNFKKGDQVYGNAKDGSLQEYTTARSHQIAHKPNNMSMCEAASIALAGATSYQSLKWYKKPGPSDKILIIGASGGCGSLGVQIAKSFGSTVYGVCSERNVNFVKSLGCDYVIDYSKPNFLETLKGVKFDLIYDAVTSPEDPDQEPTFRQFLAESGNYVAINAPSPFAFVRSKLRLEKSRDYHLHLLEWNTEDLEFLRTLIENNQLKSAAVESLSLTEENVNQAFAKLQGRRTVGKIAFNI